MTNTDTSWTERLINVMPENFMANIANNFQANAGFLTNMINRIGLTVISGVDSPYNPFVKYTGQTVDFGDTIQKYKIDFIKAEQYDPDNTNPFTTTKNEPYAQYATINDRVQYHERINKFEFLKAFTSDNKLGDFIAGKLDSMYESDGLDKYIKWKKYLSDQTKYKTYTTVDVDPTDTDVFAGELWDTIRLYANSKFRQPNTAYNIAGHIAISPSVDIIMRSDDKLLVDKYLKGVYNLDKTSVNANIILIDDFATLRSSVPGGEVYEAKPEDADELVAVILDSRAIKYYPRTPETGAIYNPKGLNMEYYLTVEGTYCFDKFRNMMPVYTKAE